MKVKIGDSKDDVKEMTIEDLEKEKFIGIEIIDRKFEHYKLKYFYLEPISLTHGLHNFSMIEPSRWNHSNTKYKLLESTNDGTVEFHVFKTGKELHRWLGK